MRGFSFFFPLAAGFLGIGGSFVLGSFPTCTLPRAVVAVNWVCLEIPG